MIRSTITVGILAVALGMGAGSCRELSTHPAMSATSAPPREIALNLGSTVTMKLVLIPAGQFAMGSPEDEKDRLDFEGPQHEVAITRPFYMGMYEVTQEQYTQIMGTNPSNYKSPQKPVERVSWDDAVEFCEKLAQKTGRSVRLPTEAEWEYACRAGTSTAFNTGETISKAQANCSSRSGDLVGKTMRVGAFKPNAWGLYDMHGNVWEWCADRFRKDSYANAEKADPQGPACGSYRVVRGGYYGSYPQDCRSARRDGIDPEFRLISLGFRVVVDLK